MPQACDKYKDLKYHALIPSVANEIELIKMYGALTLAVCLNTKGIPEDEAKEIATNLEQELKYHNPTTRRWNVKGSK